MNMNRWAALLVVFICLFLTVGPAALMIYTKTKGEPCAGGVEYKIDSLTKEVTKLKNEIISRDFGHEPIYTVNPKTKELSKLEIEILRQKDPNHIYSTKGRINTAEDYAREELTDDQIEEYLDFHGH